MELESLLRLGQQISFQARNVSVSASKYQTTQAHTHEPEFSVSNSRHPDFTFESN